MARILNKMLRRIQNEVEVTNEVEGERMVIGKQFINVEFLMLDYYFGYRMM